MLMGAESARFPIGITIGSLIPDAMNNISCMSANPCEAVQVQVRAPVALAPIHALIAECSDSTSMNWESSSPSAIYSDILSGNNVEGVIGYAGITSGRQSFAANAVASLPRITVFMDITFFIEIWR
jgi:hypothetical protein